MWAPKLEADGHRVPGTTTQRKRCACCRWCGRPPPHPHLPTPLPPPPSREACPRNGLGNEATAADVRDGGRTCTATFTPPPSFGFEGEVASFTGALLSGEGKGAQTVCEFEAVFQVVKGKEGGAGAAALPAGVVGQPRSHGERKWSDDERGNGQVARFSQTRFFTAFLSLSL